MYKDIKDVMDVQFKHLKIDNNLVNQLRGFRLSWMQKSPEYIEFLGGKTLGVHSVRFSTLDDALLFNDILGVDLDELRTEIYRVKGINPKWKVTSNPIYLSLMYLIHKIHTSSNIKNKEVAINELGLIFFYKVMSSLLSHYFKYNTTEDIAKTVVEKLSNKFLIKKLDNWQELFEYRVNDFLKGGLHYKRMQKFTTDDATRIVMDAQGRIRDIVKNIYSIMDEVSKSGDVIKTTTLLEETEDGVGLKDISERPDNYLVYVKSIYNTPSSFINDDLIYLLKNIIPNLDPNMLKMTLRYLSEHVTIKEGSDNDFITVSVVKTISYINNKNLSGGYNKNIVEILKYMKNYWSSSSVKDDEIKNVKKYLFKVVTQVTKKKTKWAVSITIVGILMYVFLRALVKNR